jgi:PAS domain S-box-containing protein
MHKFFLTHQDFAEEAAKIGVWDFNGASGKVDWSHGMERIYGLPRGSFKGTVEDFTQRIHPDDVAHNLLESQRSLATRQPFDITFRIIRADGAVRWVNSRGSARWDANDAFLGASGIQIDISEQVKSNQDMQLKAQVLANMAEGVAMVHIATGTFVYTNLRFEQILGYAVGDLLGQHVSVINAASDLAPTEVAQRIMNELHRHGHWRGEVKNRCADGREIWIHATVTEFLHDELGKVWIGVHTDINAQRQAQHARDEALDQLRRLSLNIQESIEAERIAVSRDVHDQLGAALTGIRMKLETLAAQAALVSDKLATSLLEVARTARSTQLAAREICTRLRPQVLDDVGLVEACRWYVKDWSASVGIPVIGRFAKLNTEPDDKVATDMFRVMQELLTNVAQHASARRVRVSLSGGASTLNMRVQDDGHGFEPKQTTTGFGLMGVRERVRQHAGMFLIESNPAGTTVRVSMKHLTVP